MFCESGGFSLERPRPLGTNSAGPQVILTQTYWLHEYHIATFIQDNVWFTWSFTFTLFGSGGLFVQGICRPMFGSLTPARGQVALFIFSSDRSFCSDEWWFIIFPQQQLFQIFTQSIGAIYITSVTLGCLNSINAIDVTRCWLMLIECQMFQCSNVQMLKFSIVQML